MRTYIKIILTLFLLSNIIFTVCGQVIHPPFSDEVAIPLKESGFVRIKNRNNPNDVTLYSPNALDATISKKEDRKFSKSSNGFSSAQYGASANYSYMSNDFSYSEINTFSMMELSLSVLSRGGGYVPFSDPYVPGTILDPTNVTPQELESLPVGEGIVLLLFAFIYISFIVFRKKLLRNSNYHALH